MAGETSCSDIFALDSDDDDTARRFRDILYNSPGAKTFFNLPPRADVTTELDHPMGQAAVKSRSFLLSPVGMVLKELQNEMPPPVNAPLKKMLKPVSSLPLTHRTEEILPSDEDLWEVANDVRDPLKVNQTCLRPDMSPEVSDAEEPKLFLGETPVTEAEDEDAHPPTTVLDDEEVEEIATTPSETRDKNHKMSRGGNGCDTDRNTTGNEETKLKGEQQDTPQNIESPKDPSETVLDGWYLTQPHKRIIVIEGHRSGDPEQNLWHSSAISKRLSPRLLVTMSGSKYRLVGPMEVDMTLEHGFTSDVVKKFVNGFPVDWKEIIQDQYLQKEESKDKEPKEKVKATKKSNKLPSKSKRPPKSTPTTKRKPQTKGTGKLMKTPVGGNKVPIDTSKLRTPLVIPIDEVQCTRSGRRVLPPLAYWTGERQRENVRLNKVEVIAGRTADRSVTGTYMSDNTPRLSGLEVEKDLVQKSSISSRIKRRNKARNDSVSNKENASRGKNKRRGKEERAKEDKRKTGAKTTKGPEEPSKSRKESNVSQEPPTKTKTDRKKHSRKSNRTTQDKVLDDQVDERSSAQAKSVEGSDSHRGQQDEKIDEEKLACVRPKRRLRSEKMIMEDNSEAEKCGVEEIPDPSRPPDGNSASGEMVDSVTSADGGHTTMLQKEQIYDEELDRQGDTKCWIRDNKNTKDTKRKITITESTIVSRDASRVRQRTKRVLQPITDEVDPQEAVNGKTLERKPKQAHGNVPAQQRKSKRLLKNESKSYREMTSEEESDDGVESLIGVDVGNDEDPGEGAHRTRTGKTWSLLDTMDAQKRKVTNRDAPSRDRKMTTKLNSNTGGGISQRTRSRERNPSPKGLVTRTRSSQRLKKSDRYTVRSEVEETEGSMRNTRSQKRYQKEPSGSLDGNGDVSGKDEENPTDFVVSAESVFRRDDVAPGRKGNGCIDGVTRGQPGHESETKEQSSDTESMKQARVAGKGDTLESAIGNRRGLTATSFDIYGDIMGVLTNQKQRREQEQEQKRLSRSLRGSIEEDEDIVELGSTADDKRNGYPSPAGSVNAPGKKFGKATLRITPIAINGLAKAVGRGTRKKSQDNALTGSFQSSPPTWSQENTGKLNRVVDPGRENKGDKENKKIISDSLGNGGEKDEEKVAGGKEAVRPSSRSKKTRGRQQTVVQDNNGLVDVPTSQGDEMKRVEDRTEGDEKHCPGDQPTVKKPVATKPSKADKPASKGPVIITAKKGTLKRKRQLRELAEHHNMGFEEDMLAATPTQKTKRKKFLYSDDSDEDEGLDAFTLGKTPSNNIPSLKPFSSKKTPHSSWTPGLLQSINRNKTEQYIFRMQKRNKLGKQKSTPNVSRATSKLGGKPKKFQNLMNIKESEDPFKVTEINGADSDEDRDYYWSDEEI